MEKVINRTYRLKSSSRELVEVFSAIGLQAKNIRNRAVFVVSNVFSAFGEDAKIKENLHENEAATLTVVRKHIANINAARQQKAAKKNAAPKLLKSLEEGGPWVILDRTLLDNIVRIEPDITPAHPYKAVPAAIAQAVINGVINEMQCWAKAVKAYKKNPSGFNGQPMRPGYTEKDGRTSISIPFALISGGFLPSVKKRVIPVNLACTQYLTDEQKELWDNFDLGAELDRSLSWLKDKSTRPLVLRIQFGNGKPRFEVVVERTITYDDDSLIARTYQLAYEKSGERRDTGGNVKAKEPTEKMLHDALQELAPFVNAAGGDPGNTNMMNIAFADGTKGLVISGRRVTAKMAACDARMDAWKAANTPPRLKELISKRDKLPDGELLPKHEQAELRRETKQFYMLIHMTPLIPTQVADSDMLPVTCSISHLSQHISCYNNNDNKALCHIQARVCGALCA